MASLRVASASLLTTVTSVADTATALVTSVGTSAKMLNDFADNAHWQQSKRIAASKVGFEQRLKDEQTLEIAKSRGAVQDYLRENPDQADEILLIQAALDAALA